MNNNWEYFSYGYLSFAYVLVWVSLQAFCSSLNWAICLLIIGFISSLNILNTSPLSGRYNGNIFCSECLVFSFAKFVFWWAVFHLMNCHLSIFFSLRTMLLYIAFAYSKVAILFSHVLENYKFSFYVCIYDPFQINFGEWNEIGVESCIFPYVHPVFQHHLCVRFSLFHSIASVPLSKFNRPATCDSIVYF